MDTFGKAGILAAIISAVAINQAHAVPKLPLGKGCAILNGTVSFSAIGSVKTGNTIASGFTIGDVITVKASATALNSYFYLMAYSGPWGPLSSNLTTGQTASYTITAASPTTIGLGYALGGTSTASITCAPASSGNIQTSAAQTEGGNSQHVMNDMLDGIIDGSLNSSFQPISGNENGVQFMAAPDIKVQPTADAPHALESDSPWRMWMAGRYTHASGSETGNQFNGLFGTSYRLSDHSTLGLFGGYEGFNYTDAAPAQFSGNGYTIGGFAAGSFSERLKLDARAYTTFLNYNIVSGGANGSTTATRFGSSVTASYDLLQGPTTLTFFLRGSGLFEWQSAYTDSLAAVHAAQNLSQGSLAPGLKLSHHAVLGNGDSFTPYAAAEANWIFGNTTLAGFSGTQGISGKVSAGAQWSNAHGTTLGLNASYGGIGSSINSQSIEASLSIPF